MKTRTAHATKASKSFGNFERDRKIKKVGKAPHHKPKHRNAIFNESED